MTPDLTDRDRERFAHLRELLDGVERVTSSEQTPPPRRGAFDPMLATTFRGDLERVNEDHWVAERKFDGTRIILQKFDGEVSLFTRRHIDRAETLSALSDHAKSVLPDGLILDGEYCFLTPEGVSRFLPIHQSSGTVERENLSARYFVFDILATEDDWHLREPLITRKTRLTDIVPENEFFAPVDHVGGTFQTYYDDIINAGEEGIILKRRTSRYLPGIRSSHWRKVKAFTEADVLAVGFTPGEGRRSETFGALVLTDGERYLGRVGSGFDEATLDDLTDTMTAIDDYPVSPDSVGRAYTPVEPLVIRVKFQEINTRGKLRAPVFLGQNPDKPVEDVEPLIQDSVDG